MSSYGITRAQYKITAIAFRGQWINLKAKKTPFLTPCVTNPLRRCSSQHKTHQCRKGSHDHSSSSRQSLVALPQTNAAVYEDWQLMNIWNQFTWYLHNSSTIIRKLIMEHLALCMSERHLYHMRDVLLCHTKAFLLAGAQFTNKNGLVKICPEKCWKKLLIQSQT